MKARESNVLVLQGGGALGAYQAGAFEGLSDTFTKIAWVAGISIGSINAAIIAGNPAERRVERLRTFWERATSMGLSQPLADGYWARGMLNRLSAAATAMVGVPGFFNPRFPPAALLPFGATGATSYYDTAPLRRTLEELVDFDLLNTGDVRFSVGAVNVETGNMTWFDSTERTIRPEHVMASGALPPGFPAVQIDGVSYWDGGLVSNTPLQYVLDKRLPDRDLCVFQVDLFNARGPIPRSVWEIEAREKDIRFSSRTRFNTDMMRRLHETRAAARRLYDRLPAAMKDDPDARAMIADAPDPRITIAHLIYRQTRYESASKDYEFSRRSMQAHWAAGSNDAKRTMTHPDWEKRHQSAERMQVFDLSDARA